MDLVLQLCYGWRYKGNNFQMDRRTGKSGGKMQREEPSGSFVQLQSIVVFKCLLPTGVYCIQCFMTNSKTFQDHSCISGMRMRSLWLMEWGRGDSKSCIVSQGAVLSPVRALSLGLLGAHLSWAVSSALVSLSGTQESTGGGIQYQSFFHTRVLPIPPIIKQ